MLSGGPTVAFGTSHRLSVGLDATEAVVQDGALGGTGEGVSVPVDNVAATRLYAVFVGGFVTPWTDLAPLGRSGADRWLGTFAVGMGHEKDTQITGGLGLTGTSYIENCDAKPAFAIEVGVRWLAGALEAFVSPRVTVAGSACGGPVSAAH